jgi:hypothetical protein
MTISTYLVDAFTIHAASAMEVWRHGVLEAWQACGRGGIDGEMERWRDGESWGEGERGM